MPLDWGTEVPLDFLRAPRVVVVVPRARPPARGARARRRRDRTRHRPSPRAAGGVRRERRPRPRARPGRPVRLRPRRRRLRRARPGDPRVGTARLPAARPARRSGEGRLALAAARAPGRARGGRAVGRARVCRADVLRDARARPSSPGGTPGRRASRSACRPRRRTDAMARPKRTSSASKSAGGAARRPRGRSPAPRRALGPRPRRARRSSSAASSTLGWNGGYVGRWLADGLDKLIGGAACGAARRARRARRA